MTAVALGDSAGWLHEGTSRTGVVLCGAEGFEGLCTHQSLRILADTVALSGPHVLRFDYPGQGDALDPPADAPLLPCWIDSIGLAVTWLRQNRGVDRVVLVGLRLGGLLALEAAQANPDLDALVLIAPPASGAAYLREMKATARMLGTIKLGCGVSDTGIELCGFQTDSALQKAISDLKPAALTHAPARRILLAEATERPCDALAEVLDRLGGTLERLPFEGCTGLLAAPTSAVPPMALFRQVASWLAGPKSEISAPSIVPAGLSGSGFCEQRVTFGPENALSGVLCEPTTAPAQAARTVLMLNAGAISHVGWARMSVDHARALVRQGVPSFRVDLSGIGDSIWHEGGARPLLYSRQHVTDARSALDCLEARGFANFLATGLCAGGYVALHAAHQDSRIKAVLPVNVDKFVWHDHYDIDVIEQELNQSAASYSAQAFTGTAWKRILAGDVSAQRIVAILKLLSTKAVSRVVDPLGAAVGLEWGLDEDDRFIRSVFADLAGRGVRTSLLYADRDPGIDELDRHMGPQARFLRTLPGFSLDVVANADHEFTPLAAREKLLEHLLALARGATTALRQAA